MIKLSVFENEGNVSQDANFRAHLDNNWNAGNREFDNLWSRINSFDDLFSQFSNLAERMTELEKENKELNESVINLRNELTNVEKDYSARLQKLEDAVYGTNPESINNDLFFINHPVRIDDQEINNDDEDAVQIQNSTPVIHDNLPKEQVRTQLLNNTDIGGNLKNDTNSK